MKEKIYRFEKLAQYAIKKEIERFLAQSLIEGVKTNFFVTSFLDQTERRRTITVWFEMKSKKPRFWDIQPVIIVFKGHKLYLSDICQRAGERAIDTLRRFQKRQIASIKRRTTEGVFI